MRAFVIGLAASGVLLAAMFIVPRFLSGSERANAVQSEEQAELARRLYLVYNQSLAPLGIRANMDGLKNADFDRLVKAAQDRFDTLQKQFSQEAQELRSSDQRLHARTGPLKTVTGDSSGVRAAVAGFDKIFADNRALLTEAIKNAQEANRAGAGAVGVGQVLGVLKLTDATDAFRVVRQLRTQSEAAQAHALSLASDWTQATVAGEHYAKLDPAEVLTNLRKDAEDMTALVADAQQRAETLMKAVSARKVELEEVRKGLEEGRAQWNALDEAGFQAGNDAAFEQYKKNMLELSAKLIGMQETEQRLATGGVVNGKVSGDLLSDFRIEGGEPTDGLDELERKLAIAKDQVERYTRGAAAIEREIVAIEASGKSSHELAAAAGVRADEIRKSLEATVADMDKLNKEIAEREKTALDAAAASTSAFGAASQAIGAWISSARDLQQTSDLEKRNGRLTTITKQNAELLAGASQARAKLLTGQIQAERAAAATTLKATLAHLSDSVKGLAVDATGLDDTITNSREAAVKSLTEAASTFMNLSKRPGVESWVFQAGLATVAYNLAQVDTANREQHLTTASANIRTTMDRLKQSPYGAPLAAFSAKLAGPAAESAPAPAPGGDKVPEKP